MERVMGGQALPISLTDICTSGTKYSKTSITVGSTNSKTKRGESGPKKTTIELGINSIVRGL